MGDEAPYKYEVISEHTLLVYADMKIYSLAPTERNIGWMREVDLSFWVPVVGLKRQRNGAYLVDHIAFFLPHLFVDNGYAIATGREVYGFRKIFSVFQHPADIRNPEFCVDTLAFKTFNAETEGVMQRLLTVRRVQVAAYGPLEWSNGPEAANHMLDLLWGKDEESRNLVAGHLLANVQVPIVFLKQFRDAQDSSKAAYQAIVKAPAIMQTFHGGGLIPHTYQLTVEPLESHPIAAELGLQMQAGQQEAEVAFWLQVDFPMQEGEVLWQSVAKRQKVAILGGGVGALSTAFGLTSVPDWQEKFDITVYQMGWRLGGKGASGRDQQTGQRIEEHGLHLWFGFYENAFSMIRQCYAELARPTNAPLATWDAAFKPYNGFVLEDFFQNQWSLWPLADYFPPRPGEPGDGQPTYHFWDLRQRVHYFMKELATWLLERFVAQYPVAARAGADASLQAHIPEGLQPLAFVGKAQRAAWLGQVAGPGAPSVMAGLEARMHAFIDHELHPDDFFKALAQPDVPPQEARGALVLGGLLHTLAAMVHGLEEVGEAGQKAALWVLRQGMKLLQRLHESQAHIDLALHHMLLLLELGMVTLAGMIEDEVFSHGFEAIEQYDFRQWLKQHGASDILIYCALVRMIYDLPFGYPGGDTGTHEPSQAGNIGAGTALHSLLLILFGYKGQVAWKMQAGMGDVVFAPLYQILKARGVTFKFFHKVEELIPNPQTGTIDTIRLTRQVRLRQDLAVYDPLFTVRGLPCWPSQPLYEQLDPHQARELQDKQINLESYWTAWDQGEPVTLTKGPDFDLVVLGISLGALPALCPKLADQAYNPSHWQAWSQMLTQLPTVATLAIQLWLTPDLAGLGWQGPSPILGGYAQPFNTWADMIQTLGHEAWPAAHEPKDVAYFCGPLPDEQPSVPIPPFSQHDFPAKQQARVYDQALAWLRDNVKRLWPQFTWDMLVDLQNRVGEQRLQGQYWRANVEPTERYVLSVAGSSQYRLTTDASGLRNLYLTGDWVNNRVLNVGAVEPAVLAGLQAARALAGYPGSIAGEFGDSRALTQGGGPSDATPGRI